MALVSERALCLSTFAESDTPPEAYSIFVRESVRDGPLGRLEYYKYSSDVVLDDGKEVILVLHYRYFRDRAYFVSPILSSMCGGKKRLCELGLGNLAPYLTFVLRYHRVGPVPDGWVSAVMNGSQPVSKAIWSLNSEERVSRLVQICGLLLSAREFVEKLMYIDGEYGASILKILVRLSVLEQDHIDANFFRAVMAGKINRDRLLNILYMPELKSKCLLCEFCPLISFNSYFKLGKDTLRGTFIIEEEGCHADDVAGWIRCSSVATGVMTDVGHVVVVRATDMASRIINERFVSWAYRVFRRCVHARETSIESRDLYLIMDHCLGRVCKVVP